MKPLCTPLLVFTLTLMTGCLVSHTSNSKREGHFVADTTFNKIEPGKTKAAWVKATLGDPDKRDEIENGHEIWKWSYTERKESTGAIFLIFGGHDESEIRGTAYVEIKDGVVTNKWRG